MAEDECAGVAALELDQERMKCCLLLRSTGVLCHWWNSSPLPIRGGLGRGPYSPLITDTDAMGIVVLAVCADNGLVTALVDAAIYLDVVVVADVLETAVTDMIVATLLEGEPPVHPRGTAVNDDKGDETHSENEYENEYDGQSY